MHAIGFAKDVLNMHATIMQLRAEVFELRKYKGLYEDLLNETLEHNQKMIAGMLCLAIKNAANDKEIS